MFVNSSTTNPLEVETTLLLLTIVVITSFKPSKVAVPTFVNVPIEVEPLVDKVALLSNVTTLVSPLVFTVPSFDT